MSDNVVDISDALEARRHQAADERLKQMRAAFRAARLNAAGKGPTRPGGGSGKRRGKKRHPSR
ncbi:MAG: hypothetical protein KDI28_00130 [Pseudomonadales bacterium]|nr:hypothetical protein [Pseudomonadales bacterium]MCP5359019.1 hypothetical protein [Pseudomonadales bacterium]